MKTEGYWVYEITTPNEMVYVGMSCQKYTCNRWRQPLYKSTALQSYIEEFGWDTLKEAVVKDGLTKEEAFQLEDELIRKYKEEGRCINKVCSGGLNCDGKRKEYQKQYDEEHKDVRKQWRDTHKDHKREYDRKYYARQKELRLRAELNYDTLW